MMLGCWSSSPWDNDETLARIPVFHMSGPRSAAVALGWSQQFPDKVHDISERAVLNFQQPFEVLM
jgi:hypothetical protein